MVSSNPNVVSLTLDIKCAVDDPSILSPRTVWGTSAAFTVYRDYLYCVFVSHIMYIYVFYPLKPLWQPIVYKPAEME